jgi:hypothetical protein
MFYKGKVAVCSEIVQNTQTQCGHHVNFLMLNLVVRKVTARL